MFVFGINTAQANAISVEDYVKNPKLAYATVKECDSKIATLSDHEKVYGPSGKCRNAMLAKKQIIKKRNSASNAKPTFDFSQNPKN